MINHDHIINDVQTVFGKIDTVSGNVYIIKNKEGK